MTNPCTCKAEHWQPHDESCPAYKPKPLLTVENIRSGAVPADKFAAGFLLSEVERLLAALLSIDSEVSGCGTNCSKDFLRLGLTSVQAMARGALRGKTTSPEPRAYCPNCDCDYCGSVQGRLERSLKSGEQHGG